MNNALIKQLSKSIEQLKRLGIKFYVEQTADNEAIIVIDSNSIIELIKNKIEYPNKEVTKEDKYILIRIWK